MERIQESSASTKEAGASSNSVIDESVSSLPLNNAITLTNNSMKSYDVVETFSKNPGDLSKVKIQMSSDSSGVKQNANVLAILTATPKLNLSSGSTLSDTTKPKNKKRRVLNLFFFRKSI